MAIQKGIFLFPCNLKKSFEENLCLAFSMPIEDLRSKNATKISIEELTEEPSVVNDIRVLKINLKRIRHTDAISDLYSMNIDAASLFPGLEGFAKSLKYSVRLREQIYLPRLEDLELENYISGQNY